MSELYFYLIIGLMLVLSFLMGLLVLVISFTRKIQSIAFNMPCEAENEG
ncbi:MAG: hypothetical protein KAS17_04760 [Victivallaceae bacterium]|nr:hypothetical protein [Victivallaceae bacterium]